MDRHFEILRIKSHAQLASVNFQLEFNSAG